MDAKISIPLSVSKIDSNQKYYLDTIDAYTSTFPGGLVLFPPAKNVPFW